MFSLITNLDQVSSVLTNRDIDRPLPTDFPLLAIFKIVHISHFCFRLIQRQRAYTQNRNDIEFVASNLLNFYLSDRSIVHYGAQCVLITRTLIDITKTQAKVTSASKHLIDCLSFCYPYPCEFIKEERDSNLSHLDQNKDDRVITMLSSLPTPIFDVTLRIHAVTQATFELISQLFALSLQLLELFEAFVMDRIMQYESITGLFENSREIYKTISDDPKALVDELERNKLMIDKLLTLAQMPFRVKDMRSKIIDVCDISNRIVKAATSVIDEIKESTQEVTYELTYLMGSPLVSPSKKNYSLYSERSIYEHNSSFDSTRPARKWPLNGRFYTS